jgi:hypothetical protein
MVRKIETKYDVSKSANHGMRRVKDNISPMIRLLS